MIAIDDIINSVLVGDSLELLGEIPASSIDTVITSPPYWQMRDYGNSRQIGMETNLSQYLENLTSICKQIFRVLKESGSFWLNIGDKYHKKDLLGIPWQLMIMIKEQGWILRNACIWQKTNPMPSSVKDRLNQNYEYLFHLVKSRFYYYDLDSVRVPHKTKQQVQPSNDKKAKNNIDSQTHYDHNPRRQPGSFGSKAFHPAGKNPGALMRISPARQKDHPAAFPKKLCQIPIKAACPPDGIVLDPFCGIGTALKAAKNMNRNFIGIELNPEYAVIAAAQTQAQLKY